MVKTPPANAEMRETQARFLGQKDSLEDEMVTHSSILSWRVPWTEEPGGQLSIGLQSWTKTEATYHTCNREEPLCLTEVKL